MLRIHRKTVVQVTQWVAVALVLLDGILYLALARPLWQLAATGLRERDLMQRRVRDRQLRIELLKKLQAAVPRAEEEVKVFLREHIPPRRRGFSRAAHLVRSLTEESDVQLSGVSYRLDSSGDTPLERLSFEVTVEGHFPELLKFAHGLETASDFVLIRNFTFQPGEGGNLALRLAADMYLVP